MHPPDFVTALSDPAAAARLLDAAAERTGDARFRQAAGMLRGRPGGRPLKADDGALTRMAALLEEGAAGTPGQAARLLARTMQGEKSSGAVAARLVRKFRAAHRLKK